MKIEISFTKEEFIYALTSKENFEQFLDVLKCRYEMAEMDNYLKAIASYGVIDKVPEE